MASPPPGSLRVVLDTNVLISALHFPDGALAGLWPALNERARLILSPAIVAELAGKLRDRFGWDEGELQRLLRALVRRAELVRPSTIPDAVAGDPDDNHIIACAIAGRADLIVSGDRDLLRLKTYAGIPIVRPMDFVRMVGGGP
jgi:putative PIN family toxin of toxin-antitoxin system